MRTKYDRWNLKKNEIKKIIILKIISKKPNMNQKNIN